MTAAAMKAAIEWETWVVQMQTLALDAEMRAALRDVAVAGLTPEQLRAAALKVAHSGLDELDEALRIDGLPEMAPCRCGEPAGPEHCDHCHNDPPRGHLCPRCGAAPRRKS